MKEGNTGAKAAKRDKEVPVTAAKLFGGTKKFMAAYTRAMTPLSERTGLPTPAIDIILFLANNPGYDTAKDICRIRGFKPAIVSFHIDKLVEEGFVERRSDPKDRRKCCLVCAEKSGELIDEGRKIQDLFAKKLLNGLTEEETEIMKRCMEKFANNLNDILEKGLGGDNE